MVGLAFLVSRPPGLPTGQASVGAPAIGGAFTMVDTDGKPVDERVLQGKWSAVFFGYTYCPDICPATMTALTAVKARLGKSGDDLQTVFVSIDPARDTPAQLKAYLDSPAFPRPVVGILVALLFVANTVNIGADLAAMGAAAHLVAGGGAHDRMLERLLAMQNKGPVTRPVLEINMRDFSSANCLVGKIGRAHV